jgi:hypothetical protein
MPSGHGASRHSPGLLNANSTIGCYRVTLSLAYTKGLDKYRTPRITIIAEGVPLLVSCFEMSSWTSATAANEAAR